MKLSGQFLDLTTVNLWQESPHPLSVSRKREKSVPAGNKTLIARLPSQEYGHYNDCDELKSNCMSAPQKKKKNNRKI